MQKIKQNYKIIAANLLKITSLILIAWSGLYLISKHIYLNVSISEPLGYYFAFNTSEFKSGDRAFICVNDSAHLLVMHRLKLPYQNNACPYKTPFLLKRVAGVPGDTIDITEKGILVNGIMQPNSIRFTSYKNILLEPIPIQKFKLKKNEYFMLGESPHSYDSRYFGIVRKEQIKYKAILLWKKQKL